MTARPGLATTLFLCLFAAQAAVLVLSPILPQVAGDLGVSTATAGQLRAISGIAGGLSALAVWAFAGRVPVRSLLLGGLALLAAAALLSAAAPSFAVLAAAQVPLGAGVAVVLSAAVAAAGEWAPAPDRARVLAWTLLGQPAAWVVGMPLVGLIAAGDWRLAWIGLPFAASALALAATRGCARDSPPATPLAACRRIWRRPAVAGWALGELLAFAGWGGVLVFAGALLRESYGLSVGLTGLALGAAAAAYFPGALIARRQLERRTRALLVGLGAASAAAIALFGVVRPSAGVSVALLAVTALLIAGRTLAGSAFGLDAAPGERVAVMGIRAAATQFGYLLGAALGGVALAAGGFSALGLVLGASMALAVVPHLAARRSGRGR